MQTKINLSVKENDQRTRDSYSKKTPSNHATCGCYFHGPVVIFLLSLPFYLLGIPGIIVQIKCSLIIEKSKIR